MSLATHSRRRILFGLGAACAAATASPEIGHALPAENPALIALGDALPGAVGAYQDSRATVAQIVAAWSPQWPVPDPEIIRYGQGSKTHRGIDGRGIEVAWGNRGVMRVPDLGTPEYFEAEWLRCQAEARAKAATKSQRGLKFATKWAERHRAAIAPSAAYWAEVERITAASGFEAAQAAEKDAREALRALIGAIMATDEATISGVVVKAQALAAWGEVDYVYRAYNPEGHDWAANLATSIMRQSGGVI